MTAIFRLSIFVLCFIIAEFFLLFYAEILIVIAICDCTKLICEGCFSSKKVVSKVTERWRYINQETHKMPKCTLKVPVLYTERYHYCLKHC